MSGLVSECSGDGLFRHSSQDRIGGNTMITIEILDSWWYPGDPTEGDPAWECLIELTDGSETRMAKATVPGEADMTEPEMLTYLAIMDEALWETAHHEDDIVVLLREPEIRKRITRLLLSEINILREVAGLPPRTMEQFKEVLKRRE